MRISEFLKDSFSFSKMSCFSKCPRKFFYRYIVGRRESTVFQIIGKAVHKGQETDNLAKLKGETLSIEQVLEAAVYALKDECAKMDQKKAPLALDSFVTEHRTQLVAYEKSGARASINPVPDTIEAPFKIAVNVGNPETGKPEAQAEIIGFVDLVSHASNGTKEVIDYKTGRKHLTQREANDSLQFQLYTLGAEAQGARAVSFVRAGRQKPTAKVTGRTEKTEERQSKLMTWIADCIRAIRRCILTGDYPKCEPSCFWCSPTACDFYGMCYGPGSAPKTLIQVERIDAVGSLEKPAWRKT